MAKTPKDLASGLFTEDAFTRATRQADLDHLRHGLGVTTVSKEIVEALGRNHPVFDSKLVDSITGSQKVLAEVARPYGGVAQMARAIAERQKQFSKIVSGFGGLAGLERQRLAHLTAGLGSVASLGIQITPPGIAKILKDLEATQLRYAKLDGFSGLASRGAALDRYRLNDPVREALEHTRAKLSLVGGIAEVHGTASSDFESARHALLGEWHTSPDLPASFFRDRRIRERHYRRAEVDYGLIAAPPAVAVEILIDSGFAAGIDEGSGGVAIFAYAGVSVAVRATDAQADAYRAIFAFERGLRAYIATRLEAQAGPQWTKQRLPGPVLTNAKGRRDDALKSGEAEQSLLDYTELGELKDIVLRTDNWDEVFGAAFLSRTRFEHDMLTLMGLRRPVAHARIVDSTQLIEALLVMRRLDGQLS